MSAAARKGAKPRGEAASVRFEGARTDKLHEVLDAIAWLSTPTVSEVAQFAGVDPRTAGKLLKNCVSIGLVECINKTRFTLLLPYPHKGSSEQKQAVIREALIRMPLLETVRQFSQLGDSLDVSLRKAAAVHKVEHFDPAALSPLLTWARQYQALVPGVAPEDLLIQAEEARDARHRDASPKRVVFISHSSLDKPFIRKLATDLTVAGVGVWLDEQRIRVGDSIPEKIAQGLAESDYYLIAVSQNSLNSEWVKKELNAALVDEVSRRKVSILPLRLGEVEMPLILKDKKYADFSRSYKTGFEELLKAIRAED